MITQVRFTENQLDRKPKLFDAYVSLCNISVVILNKKYEKNQHYSIQGNGIPLHHDFSINRWPNICLRFESMEKIFTVKVMLSDVAIINHSQHHTHTERLQTTTTFIPKNNH